METKTGKISAGVLKLMASLLGALMLGAIPAQASSITIFNSDFQAPLLDEDGADGSPAWHWVPDWKEGGASYCGSGAGGFLYFDAGGWVSQDLDHNWTTGEVFTISIRASQGYSAGGAFKIQLCQTDDKILWESKTMAVGSTYSNFSWRVDSAKDFPGGTPGSQLRIRMEGAAGNVYLDDVTLSTDRKDATAPRLARKDIVDDKGGGPVNPGDVVTYTVTFSEMIDGKTLSSEDFDNAGSAAVAIRAIAPADVNHYRFQIPVAVKKTGSLMLRLRAGTSVRDVAGNALDTRTEILDDTTILVTQAGDPMGLFNK